MTTGFEIILEPLNGYYPSLFVSTSPSANDAIAYSLSLFISPTVIMIFCSFMFGYGSLGRLIVCPSNGFFGTASKTVTYFIGLFSTSTNELFSASPLIIVENYVYRFSFQISL